jgi:hypothetical protein
MGACRNWDSQTVSRGVLVRLLSVTYTGCYRGLLVGWTLPLASKVSYARHEYKTLSNGTGYASCYVNTWFMSRSGTEFNLVRGSWEGIADQVVHLTKSTWAYVNATQSTGRRVVLLHLFRRFRIQNSSEARSHLFPCPKLKESLGSSSRRFLCVRKETCPRAEGDAARAARRVHQGIPLSAQHLFWVRPGFPFIKPFPTTRLLYGLSTVWLDPNFLTRSCRPSNSELGSGFPKGDSGP